jgi:hypothetical protein
MPRLGKFTKKTFVSAFVWLDKPMWGEAVIRINLVGVKPPVSREVQVSFELHLHRLHQVIRAVMGWEFASPHLFQGDGGHFGDTREFEFPKPGDERSATVRDLLPEVGASATYIYDFEEQWIHELQVVAEADPEPNPRLLSGTGACPLQGFGGAYGFEQLKLALKNRSHDYWKRDRELLRSLQKFNPNYFNHALAADRLLLTISKWQKKKRVKPPRPSRSLMIVDNEPIRRSYLNELERSRAEWRKIESELERFKDVDSASFKNWLHRTFPVEMSRIRELHEECTRLLARLSLVEQFQKHGIKSEGQAYGRAFRVESGDDPMPDFPPPPVSYANEMPDGFREIFRDAMRGLADEVGLDADETEIEMESMLDDFSRINGRTSSHEECRAIYRQIALRLHPDRGGTMTEPEARIWYRAQDAYQISDLLTLRQLWAQITSNDQDAPEISCQEIINRILETQTEIAALNAIRNVFKREAAWNFSRLTSKKLRSRRNRVERELAMQEAAVLEELEQLRAECGRVAKAHKRWEAKHRKMPEQMNLF